MSQNLFAVLQQVKSELQLFSKKELRSILAICDLFLFKSVKTQQAGELLSELLTSAADVPPVAPVLSIAPPNNLLNYSSVLNWKPKDIARAMTLLEAELFMRVLPHEVRAKTLPPSAPSHFHQLQV